MRYETILGLALFGCSTVHMGTATREESACERACARMVELGCEEAQPTSKGASCVLVCEETMRAGLVDLQPDTVASMEQCP